MLTPKSGALLEQELLTMTPRSGIQDLQMDPIFEPIFTIDVLKFEQGSLLATLHWVLQMK